MQLAYAILVSDEVFNYIREVEVEIHQRFGKNPELRLPPHITVKQPFEGEAFGPFEQYLRTLAAEVEPFEIVARGFGSFDDSGVLFLDVVQDRWLKELQARVLRDLAPYGVNPAPVERGLYHFHVTVAFGLEPGHFTSARDTYASRGVEFRFPVRELALFYRIGPNEWIIYKKAKLEKG